MNQEALSPLMAALEKQLHAGSDEKEVPLRALIVVHTDKGAIMRAYTSVEHTDDLGSAVWLAANGIGSLVGEFTPIDVVTKAQQRPPARKEPLLLLLPPKR